MAGRHSVVGAALLAAALGALPAPASLAQGVTPPGPPPLEVTGATRVEYDDASQTWVFLGPRVVVVRGTIRVTAPEIRYNERAHEVGLPGGGEVATPTLEVTADRLAAHLQTRHVVAEGHVSGRFSDEDPPSTWNTFTADERVVVDDRQDRKQVVASGHVMMVKGDRRLSGDRVVYDQLSRQGTADGHAEMARGSDRLRADHVFADIGHREAKADDHVLVDWGNVHGSADHATYNETARTAVLSGHVVLFRGRDTLTADRATVLLDRDTSIAEGHVEFTAYPEGAAPPGGDHAPEGAGP